MPAAINCLVNNATNLTLLLGLPAVLWGLKVLHGGKGAAATEQQINRLSLLLTLTAVLFFSGMLWILGQDGRLESRDGALLVGAFLFWQSFQVYDVLKNNLRQKTAFGLMFYLDAFIVLICAYAVHGSIDWMVPWLAKQQGSLLNAGNLG
jgi:cation:H+ antiporter